MKKRKTRKKQSKRANFRKFISCKTFGMWGSDGREHFHSKFIWFCKSSTKLRSGRLRGVSSFYGTPFRNMHALHLITSGQVGDNLLLADPVMVFQSVAKCIFSFRNTESIVQCTSINCWDFFCSKWKPLWKFLHIIYVWKLNYCSLVNVAHWIHGPHNTLHRVYNSTVILLETLLHIFVIVATIVTSSSDPTSKDLNTYTSRSPYSRSNFTQFYVGKCYSENNSKCIAVTKGHSIKRNWYRDWYKGVALKHRINRWTGGRYFTIKRIQGGECWLVESVHNFRKLKSTFKISETFFGLSFQKRKSLWDLALW